MAVGVAAGAPGAGSDDDRVASLTVYCPCCKDDVVPMPDGRCGWCDWPVAKGADPAPLRCPDCMGPKGRYCTRCRRCQLAHDRLVSEEIVLRAWDMRAQGVPMLRVARRVVGDTGYASERTCAKGLRREFVRLGLTGGQP